MKYDVTETKWSSKWCSENDSSNFAVEGEGVPEMLQRLAREQKITPDEQIAKIILLCAEQEKIFRTGIEKNNETMLFVNKVRKVVGE